MYRDDEEDLLPLSSSAEALTRTNPAKERIERKKIQRQKEQLKREVLKRSLKLHPDKRGKENQQTFGTKPKLEELQQQLEKADMKMDPDAMIQETKEEKIVKDMTAYEQQKDAG